MSLQALARPLDLGIAEIKAEFIRQRAALDECIPSADRPVAAADFGLALGRRHAQILDRLLVSLYELVAAEDARAEKGSSAAQAWTSLALGGVGSYGRGAVALKSDLDVRLVVRDARSVKGIADALLYPLWDMGLPIGHQVVTIDDLIDSAQGDLPTATTLLDFRYVAGEREIEDALKRRCDAGLFAHSELPRFMRRLEEEVAERHGRFGGSVYLLEPDVKNGEGGLRDLDVARWAAKARYGVSEPDDLVRVGALVAREAVEIGAAGELLWRIRNLLHAHAGRRSDRLTFDEQESIASLLGYGGGGEAVERLMSDYYRSARTISRSVEMILARATPVLTRRRPRDEDLGGGVRLFDGLVTMSDPELLQRDPALGLRLFSSAVDRGVPLLPYARDAIARAASDPSWAEALRSSPEAARAFTALVATRRETRLRSGSVVRELHDTGVLLAMIPEFLPVVGRVHHDVYHVYTVDVHSVAAVDRLAALARGELAAEFALACRLAAEITRPVMLFFATLLHDVGKAIGGKDHSARGADMAAVILRRLGLPQEDVEEACHLIRKHLVMYHVATRRDLDDPAAIAEFLQDVHGREGLRDLYLLTVADLSTTSPTSMTSWKARMLDELYLAASASQSGAPADDKRVTRAMQAVVQAASAVPAPSPVERRARLDFLDGYLRSMPERYILSNAPAAVAAHAELARKHEERARLAVPAAGAASPSAVPAAPIVSVALVPSRHPEAAEICVVAADRPGLLAAITAAIAAGRLEVHAAQIHSRPLPDGSVQAVDLFWVRDRGEGVEGVARALPALVRDVHAILAGSVSASELAGKRSSGTQRDRLTPEVRTQVSLDDRASPRHTVIEVLARDRPGLLFTVADALHRLGLSIAVAKINTEGTRVADVFYVSEADGSKIGPGKRAAEVREHIVQVLESLGRKGNTR
jgi:[protein-PII] uridylyltransferase